MKKRLKGILKVVLVLTGIGLVGKIGSRMYFNAFGGPVTAPKIKEHWQDIKQTIPGTASDMDSADIIRERRADVT